MNAHLKTSPENSLTADAIVPSVSDPALSSLNNSHTLPYKVHESAYVDAPVEIGTGTIIWHFSHILSDTTLGKNCRIGQNVVIGPRVVVGNNVKIQNNVSVYTGVTLEDDVFCGPSMVFTNVFNPRSEVPRNTDQDFLKTLVKKGATIGANATIVCGVTIGQYAFIGAGAVVTKNVPDYGLIYGNPARQHGWMCQCGERLTLLNNQAQCTACQKRYELHQSLDLKSPILNQVSSTVAS